MNAIRAKIGDGGRVIIPASFRQNLHLSTGDDIILHIDNNVIYITTPDQSLQKLQEMVKSKLDARGGGVSLVDELISMRRDEADNE